MRVFSKEPTHITNHFIIDVSVTERKKGYAKPLKIIALKVITAKTALIEEYREKLIVFSLNGIEFCLDGLVFILQRIQLALNGRG